MGAYPAGSASLRGYRPMAHINIMLSSPTKPARKPAPPPESHKCPTTLSAVQGLSNVGFPDPHVLAAGSFTAAQLRSRAPLRYAPSTPFRCRSFHQPQHPTAKAPLSLSLTTRPIFHSGTSAAQPPSIIPQPTTPGPHQFSLPQSCRRHAPPFNASPVVSFSASVTIAPSHPPTQPACLSPATCLPQISPRAYCTLFYLF
jgi:hypothetical protein